jgi:hypothetical protein
MPNESKLSEPGTDDGMGLPSRMIVFALAALGVLLLALAAASSDRVAPAPQRGAAATKAVETPAGQSSESDEQSVAR